VRGVGAGPQRLPGRQRRRRRRRLVPRRANREIAAALQVSSKTVANHDSHILTKLQARDRVDAVLRARNPGHPAR
jgi:DNA-binding CsgD family transcriptional regulator